MIAVPTATGGHKRMRRRLCGSVCVGGAFRRDGGIGHGMSSTAYFTPSHSGAVAGPHRGAHAQWLEVILLCSLCVIPFTQISLTKTWLKLLANLCWQVRGTD